MWYLIGPHILPALNGKFCSSLVSISIAWCRQSGGSASHHSQTFRITVFVDSICDQIGIWRTREGFFFRSKITLAFPKKAFQQEKEMLMNERIGQTFSPGLSALKILTEENPRTCQFSKITTYRFLFRGLSDAWFPKYPSSPRKRSSSTRSSMSPAIWAMVFFPSPVPPLPRKCLQMIQLYFSQNKEHRLSSLLSRWGITAKF